MSPLRIISKIADWRLHFDKVISTLCFISLLPGCMCLTYIPEEDTIAPKLLAEIMIGNRVYTFTTGEAPHRKRLIASKEENIFLIVTARDIGGVKFLRIETTGTWLQHPDSVTIQRVDNNLIAVKNHGHLIMDGLAFYGRIGFETGRDVINLQIEAADFGGKKGKENLGKLPEITIRLN